MAQNLDDHKYSTVGVELRVPASGRDRRIGDSRHGRDRPEPIMTNQDDDIVMP